MVLGVRSIDSNEAAAVPDEAGEDGQPISRALVLLLAIAVGASVANIYYIQPLLNVVRGEFGVSDTIAGLLVTCSQVGYVLGLALLVPLGDLCERRRLVSTVLVVAAVALAACAAAPTFAVLAGALVAVGALSVVAQILVPLAASLAAPHERGQVVGSVMSGLLIGILTARIVSGIVAQIGGFRLIFAIASGAMLVLAIVLRRMLPRVPATDDMSYPVALRSVFELIAAEPVLRQRMAIGALQMANFTVLWTSVAFLLGGAPYDYGEAAIGLFGLAGIAGASVAPFAGRWADRGHGRVALSLFLVAILASWALLDAGGTSVIALIAGIALLDLGVQGSQISNQSTIYALRPEARSRLTTAYMVSLFLGGVLGSLLAASVYGAAGWSAVCLLGAALAVAALAVWAASERVFHVSRAGPSRGT
jgi:predicted MFS family arabinose efflux permease